MCNPNMEAKVHELMELKRMKEELEAEIAAAEDAIKAVVNKYGLTDREADVLELINMGQGNLQIAAELGISENTVKRHVNNIFKKTETQSRHEIIFKISNIKEIDLQI